jgi:Sec-independent protein secretion pathway component TatC
VIGLSKITVRRLVTVSAILTLVAVLLMVVGILFPNPLLLVLAMSLGQLFGTSSLALYLLAIALDLQGVAEDEELGARERPQP